MSVIKAGTTLTTAYTVEADTTGALEFKTGPSATLAMSISSSGVVTFPAGAGFDLSSANITNLTATSLTVSAATYLATASGSVGIGTTSPAGNLHVNSASNTLIRVSSDSGVAGIDMGTSATVDLGRIRYDISGHYITFSTNSLERARLVGDGLQVGNCISVGNAAPATTGAGITFPATQSASSNANTLDDYEEGTWTPANASDVTVNSIINAAYTRIGRLVQAQCYIVITTTSTNFAITGLPFNALSYTSVTIGYTAGAASIGSSNYTEVGTTTMNLTLGSTVSSLGYMLTVVYAI